MKGLNEKIARVETYDNLRTVRNTPDSEWKPRKFNVYI